MLYAAGAAKECRINTPGVGAISFRHSGTMQLNEVVQDFWIQKFCFLFQMLASLQRAKLAPELEAFANPPGLPSH
jgi:hypothetical protein